MIGATPSRSPAQAGAQPNEAGRQRGIDASRRSWTPASAGEQESGMRQAAEAFEAVFLRQLIGSMRQAKLGEDLFGSAGTEQFRDIADANLADSMAAQGSFGIADLLMQQFRAVMRRVDQPDAPASHDTGPQGSAS